VDHQGPTGQGRDIRITIDKNMDSDGSCGVAIACQFLRNPDDVGMDVGILQANRRLLYVIDNILRQCLERRIISLPGPQE